MAKKHQDPNTYQIGLLSLLPDTEPLHAYIVRPADSRWTECLEELRDCSYFGFDIETWGALYEWGLDPWRGNIRLMQAALPSGRVLVTDFGGREGCAGDPKHHTDAFLAVLKPKLQCKKTKVIGHNLKFDCLWMLVKYAIESRCLRDTMLLSQIYWAGVRQYRHSLKAVADRIGFVSVDKTEQKSDFSWTLRNAQINYAAKDALLVIDIFKKLGRMLQDEGMAGVALAECGALPAWVQIEHKGMPVCKETLTSTLSTYKKVESEAIAPFKDMFPGVNPGSPEQVAKAVEAKYGIKLYQIQANGRKKYKTDQEALIYHQDKPPLKALLNWRTLFTFIHYLEALEERYMDGAVRSSYNQLGPMGTRSNSSKPNLQNPPRHGTIPDDLKHHNLPPLRGVFKVTKGQNLLIADLSQAHARLATAISGDKTLIHVYNSGEDMHCITGEGLAEAQGLGSQWTAENISKWRKGKDIPEGLTIPGKSSPQDVAAGLRQVAKPVFYGCLNAAGGSTVKRTAITDYNIDMPLELAKNMVKGWRNKYGDLFRFQKYQTAVANENSQKFNDVEFGSIRGLSNRRIFLPKYPDSFNDPPRPDSVKMSDACACTWAGDEKTVMALAMGEGGFLGVIDEHPEWGAWIANSVHDELDVVVKSEYALEAATALQTKMQAAMKTFIGDLIPVDENDAKPGDLIQHCWADK